MKKIIRSVFANLLAYFARRVLKKYRPTVIMVTGSVGKTSTKDAVAAALSQSSMVRASEKSYNSEFGVPLTILGVKNPWKSPARWLEVYGEALALLWLPNSYPRVLVLEVGADRPGDLARILKIATPDLVVLTRLPDMPVHVEAYATPDAVREEEFQPAYALAPGAPLVLSCDDHYAMQLAAPLTARLISFGFSEEADVRLATPELVIEDGRPVGMETHVSVAGETYPLRVLGAIGAPQLLAPASALAAALALGKKLDLTLKGLATYAPPPGRGRLLLGKNGCVVIDDSYNASPEAVKEALSSLTLIKERIPGTRRIAVLGDMLELGRYSQHEHEAIGRLAAEKSEVLVTVGPRALAAADAAKKAGMPEGNVYSFETSKEAVPQVLGLARKGDAVLVKGSQGIRTERIVEALVTDPEERKHLVRQESEWKRR